MTTATDRMRDDISQFLTERTKRGWEPDQDLFASGAVSSLFAMEIVVFLERTYGVVIGGADLKLDNFRTVERMTELVTRLGGATADADGSASATTSSQA